MYGDCIILTYFTPFQEELEAPYEIKYWKRTPERTAPKELASVHPFGTAPIIVEGDITVAESGAIVGERSRLPFA